MTLTQTIDITDTRRITLDVPNEVPLGKARLIIFPVKEEIQVEPSEQPKKPTETVLPKGKIGLTKKELEAMLDDCPHTLALSGILSGMGDVDLDEMRMERLAKHL